MTPKDKPQKEKIKESDSKNDRTESFDEAEYYEDGKFELGGVKFSKGERTYGKESSESAANDSGN